MVKQQANRNGDTTSGSENAEESAEPKRAGAREYSPPHEESTRRPWRERERAFNVATWLLEGALGLYEELRHNDLGLPEDFWLHAQAARRETLLALRALLDELIDEDRPPAASTATTKEKRRGPINVDF